MVFVIGVLCNAGPIVYTVPGGRWTLIAAAFLLGAIAYRLRTLQILQFLVIWGVVALLVMPVVAFAETLGSGPRRSPSDRSRATRSPNIPMWSSWWPMPTDPMRSSRSSTVSTTPASRDDLQALGVTNGTDVRANYPLTALSVSSALNLGYAVEEQHLSRSDLHVLYDMIGGNNTMARILKSAGYHQTYVESGWFGTRCRSEVDNCVAGPWPDETFYDIARSSVMRGLPGSRGCSIVQSGCPSSSSEWAQMSLPAYLTNEEPDLIYVHLLVPHPPFFLDSSCEPRPDMALAGFTTGIPGLPEQQNQERRDWMSRRSNASTRCSPRWLGWRWRTSR